MAILWSLVGYVGICVILYVLMQAKCKRTPVFKAPRSPTVFYLLSFTWGLPNVLIGSIVAAVLRITGHKPTRYGWEWCFELKGIDWGLELGVFFIAPADDDDEELKMHEHGHGIQNALLGIFTPLVVTIPSIVRFWYREFRSFIRKPCATDYSDIWFERSADASGAALIHRLKKQVICLNCRRFVDYGVVTTTQRVAFDGGCLTTIGSDEKVADGVQVFEYAQTIAFCKRCKSEVWVPEIEDQNAKALIEAHKRSNQRSGNEDEKQHP